MEVNENNPVANILKNGVNEEQLLEAVRASGYPLQTVVYEKLTNNFQILEEWSFVDSDSQEERAIDLLAKKDLYEYGEPHPRVRPCLNLIIECKQSDLPYVFFLTKDKPRTYKFPIIAGLASKDIMLTSDDDPSSWAFSVLDALGLTEHPFLRENPVFCNTFSKGARKGSKLELSGSQPYQGLVLPLLKAAAHFEKCEKPPTTAYYFDCHITIPIGVIDGPMIGVRCSEDENNFELLPWVRVSRHQAANDGEKNHLINTSAIDIVHKDFLSEYIDKHLMPFAKEFSELALKHHHVLADGKGFVAGMGDNSWTGIENRLTAKTVKNASKRTHAMFRNILKTLKGGHS